MASTITADNGVSSGSAGLKTAADSTGVLALRTTTAGGTATTAATISTSQVVDFVNTPTVNGTPLATGGGGFSGATTNAVSSSAITLTSASSQYQVAQISSYTNSYVTLPDATTMTAGSNPFVIENRSPFGANLELRNTAGTVVGYIPIGQIGTVQLVDKSTSAGRWNVETVNPQVFFNYDTASINTTTSTPLPTYNVHGIVGLSSTSFVRWWLVHSTVTGVTILYTQACTISGSTITFGAIQSSNVITTGSTSYVYQNAKIIRLSNTAFAVLIGVGWYYQDPCSGYFSYAAQRILVCTVSGTAVTFGTPSAASMPTFSGTGILNGFVSAGSNGTICRVSDTVFALFYNDAVTSTYAYPAGFSGSMSCQIVSVSGTTMTIGTKVSLGTSTYSQALSAVALSATSVFFCYAQATATGGSTGRSKVVIVSIAGTVPTFNTPVACESLDVSCFSNSTVDGALAPSATQVIFNTAYSVGEATVSGLVPTFDCFAWSAQISPLFLSTSSKAWYSSQFNTKYYLSIATGGFVTNTNGVDVLQTNLSATSATPWSPLGAQPTTSFIAYKYNTGTTSAPVLIIGTTT